MSTRAPAATARLKVASTFSVYIKMETGFVAPGGARHAWKLVSDENDGVADSKFAVHDFAVGPSHTHDFRRAKNLFVEIHGAASVFARQPRRNGVIPLRDSSDSIWHDDLLGCLDVRAENGRKHSG